MPPSAATSVPLTGRARVRGADVARVLAPVVPAAIVAVALRTPFWHAPLTADEGGYAEIARLWSRGARLYDDIWVDRPQGLIAIFRGAQAIGLGSTTGLRVVAAVAAVLALAILVGIATALCGRRVGMLAGVLMATAGASPFIESFTLSGELLASIPALLSLAAFLAYLRTKSVGWLVSAGLLTGCALLVKQSAFDAGLASAVFLIVSQRRRSVRPIAILLVSAIVPLCLAVLAAADRSAWWFAVVAYRSRGDSIVSGSLLGRLGDFAVSLPAAAAALAVPVVFAVLGWRRSPLLARLWLGAAALGVIGGGNFHAHYYVQLVPPLCLLGAVGLERVTATRRRTQAAAVAIVAVALLPAPLWAMGPVRQARIVFPHDPHLKTDAAVAAYMRAHSQPSDRIAILWAAADIYYLADRAPSGRYLWLRNVQSIPGALPEMERLLATAEPTLVAVVEPLATVDPTGRTARILRARYRLAALVEGVPVYRRAG
jgi:hypothetical protein